MIFIPSILSIVEVLIVVVPVLLTVAFVTVAERKTMASMQRRLGPNVVGYWGLLQAFADALKLLLKEYVSPTQANLILFFLGPIITLIFSLLGYAVVPYGPGSAIWDFNLGILYMLAVSSLSTYGILLAGWSANSKYAFLGSLRSTAQLISYELILSSAILLVVLVTGSLNLTVTIEFQRAVWFAIPLLPVFIIFFIGSVAETNRAPFDLAEAESELVSGFMTEHSAVIFVFFFLAEYASIVLICILSSILFLGGYLLNYIPFVTMIKDILEQYIFIPGELDLYNEVSSHPIVEGLLYGLSLGVKSSLLIFTFIWVRASFPRIRYDQLMSYSWTILLPIVIAFIVINPCIVYGFEIIPSNITLLALPFFTKGKSTNDKSNTDSTTQTKITKSFTPTKIVSGLLFILVFSFLRWIGLFDYMGCLVQAYTNEYFSYVCTGFTLLLIKLSINDGVANFSSALKDIVDSITIREAYASAPDQSEEASSSSTTVPPVLPALDPTSFSSLSRTMLAQADVLAANAVPKPSGLITLTPRDFGIERGSLAHRRLISAGKELPSHFITNVGTSLEGRSWRSTVICKYNEDLTRSGSSSFQGKGFLEFMGTLPETALV